MNREQSRVPHVCDTGFESVRESEALRLTIEFVDKWSMIVDTYEMGR